MKIKQLLCGLCVLVLLAAMAVTLWAIIRSVSRPGSAGRARSPDAPAKADRPGALSGQRLVFALETEARTVALTGDFTGWQARPMKRRNQREWYAIQPLEPGVYSYNFIVDGREVVDPANPLRGRGPAGLPCSIVRVE